MLCLTSAPENTVSTKIINGSGKNSVFNEKPDLISQLNWAFSSHQKILCFHIYGFPGMSSTCLTSLLSRGLPLFLYNYSTPQLHGIFKAASFGGTNFEPSVWEDKKNPGESRFPAQMCCSALFLTVKSFIWGLS